MLGSPNKSSDLADPAASVALNSAQADSVKDPESQATSPRQKVTQGGATLAKVRSGRETLQAQESIRIDLGEDESYVVRPVVRSERDALRPSKGSQDSSEVLPAAMGVHPKVKGCLARLCCKDLKPGTTSYQAYLTYLTLGVIYGDIGTSPLYTLSSVINSEPTNPDAILGGLSLMIYTLLIITALKYVVFILQADDFGEGGTFALFSLLNRGLGKRVKNATLLANLNLVFTVTAIIGVAAVLADGILTPAISVMGAIEGIKFTASGIDQNVVAGVSCAILVVFFLPQRFGTRKVSLLFSPIIVVWYLLLFGIGVYNISRYPRIMEALNPAFAARFLGGEYVGFGGWQSLGAAFLTVTGSEALYADLGHFNKKAVRVSAMLIVIPCLIICYLGQGAALALDPSVQKNAFYLSLPSGFLYPMLIMSILAAIVASQAMVTATFSIVAQAIRLQYFPRLNVKHTDKFEFGQVYISEINAFLLVLVIAVVAGFRDAIALGFAYGITVSLAFFLTSLLYSVVMVVHFNFHPVFGVTFFLVFGFIDANFLAANLTKFTTGGWFSVIMCVLIATTLSVWRWGRTRMIHEQNKLKKPMTELYAPEKKMDDTNTLSVELQVTSVPVPLVICLSSTTHDIPAAFAHFIRRIPIRPINTVFVTINAVQVAFVEPEFTVQPVEGHEKVWSVTLNHGYCERPPSANVIATNVIRTLDFAQKQHVFPPLNDSEILRFVDPTFIVGNDRVIPKTKSSVTHRFLVECFQVLYFFSSPPALLLSVPPENTLEVGVCVAI